MGGKILFPVDLAPGASVVQWKTKIYVSPSYTDCRTRMITKDSALPHAVPSVVGEAFGVGKGFESAEDLQVAVEQDAGAGVV